MSLFRMLCACASLTAMLASGLSVRAHAADDPAAELPKYGVAVVRPTKGNKTRGVLRLMQTEEGMRIMGQIRNLTPGKHGFHIHQFGDLRGPDGTSAGGHFSPEMDKHGAPGKASHAGDLGNITANAQGVARVDTLATDTALHFVLGRAFVVHAGADDLESQPSGDAGPRVGLAVIGIGNPEYKRGSGE